LSRYTLDGRIGALIVRGNQLRADLAEAITGATLDLSTSEVSQLTMTISDPELKLLASKLFDAGSDKRAGSQIDYGPLRLEVRAVEVVDGPALSITARDLGAYKLKRITGATVRRNMSPTESAAIDAKAAGLKFVGEASPRRPSVARAKDESAYDATGRHAEELGYLRFISAGVLYFARPSFLVKRTAGLALRWDTANTRTTPGLTKLPSCKRSGDDANGRVATFGVELYGELADKALPGMAVDLAGVPTFDGRYMIDSVGLELNDTAPATIAASTPVNPVPQPGETVKAGAAVDGGGTAEDLVAAAVAQAGDVYKLGAEAKVSDPDPDAFDCSELVQWAAGRAGVKFPDGTAAQLKAVKPIPVAQALRTRGALLFHPGHVAISLGNGRTIEAMGRKYGVLEASSAGRFTSGGLIPGLRYG
jgi:cell wall-associated NlpC family hydrolase